MNKQRKRHISRGKFERVCDMARQGLRVNAFTSMSGDVDYVVAYVVNGFIYWSESKLIAHKYHVEYYRKSIQEALK